jgi:ABC-type transport system substrate-binding protein
VVEKPSLAFVWWGMNKAVAPFDNPDVRRAVQYAVDRKAVVDAAYFGGRSDLDRHHRAGPYRPSRNATFTTTIRTRLAR